LRQLKGAKLGYINTYCTTSYFAPSILLARDGLALNDFFDAFAVAPWQGQIDAVVDGRIDATMVYEDVWLARPSNAAETRSSRASMICRLRRSLHWPASMRPLRHD